MCKQTSLAYWLDELPSENAWMSKSLITRIAFSFSSEGVTMMVKRHHSKHGKQIVWIDGHTPRECLKYLWGSYSTNRRYIVWKADDWGD